MLILQGVQRKSGNYQGTDYDNIVLHFIQDNPDDTICGVTVETQKVKTKDVREVFGGLVSNDSDWRSLLGSGMTVFCDKYGKPIKIEVEEVKKK